MNGATPAPSATDRLQRTLQRCREVAAEEVGVVRRTLDQAESLVDELLLQLERNLEETRGQGPAHDAARNELMHVRERLAGELRRALEDARSGAAQREARARFFTVALFGRTMAGKSTVREALTRGDGSTIGKGSQNTTRGIGEYGWLGLRFLDAPGIASADTELRPKLDSLAREAWRQADVVIVLLSSDGIQEAVFDGLAHVRAAAKPVVFVLNYKLDLTKDVLRRRFLAEGGLDSPRIRRDVEGHLARLRHLAVDRLGMPPQSMSAVAIHAQAAFLGRMQSTAQERALYDASNIDQVRDMLAEEVERFGTVRRLQTLLDGASLDVGTMYGIALTTARSVRTQARFLVGKVSELERAVADMVERGPREAERHVELALQPLRRGVGVFVEENLERPDVGAQWKERVEASGVLTSIERWQQDQVVHLNEIAQEFIRQLTAEASLGAVDFDTPDQYDPVDIKRSAGRLGAAAGVVLAVAELGVLMNWWNPIGWVGGALLGVSVLAGLVAWFADSREIKLKKQRAKAADQLRSSIDKLEGKLKTKVKGWFRAELEQKHAKSLVEGAKELPTRLRQSADALFTLVEHLGRGVEEVDVRLYRRTFEEVTGGPGAAVAAVARQPGELAKVRLDRGATNALAQSLGEALCERVDLVERSNDLRAEVAQALRPARVPARSIQVDRKVVRVRLPKAEIGRAVGRNGINVRLASRLVRHSIQVKEEP